MNKLVPGFLLLCSGFLYAGSETDIEREDLIKTNKFTGGIFSFNEPVIMSEFIDNSYEGSTFDLGFGLAYSDCEETVTSTDNEDEVLVFDSQTFIAGPKFSWNYNSFKISFSPSGGFLNASVFDDYVLMISKEIETEYSSLLYHNFFPDGFEAELVFRNVSYTENYDTATSVTAGLSLKKILGNYLQFQWNADGGYYSGEEWMALDVCNGITGSILPDTVYANWFLRSGVSIQLAAIDFHPGFISIPLSYQIGILDGLSGENELFHGPSFGVAIYLNKNAFPVVNIDYSYNIETEKGFFSVSAGIGD